MRKTEIITPRNGISSCFIQRSYFWKNPKYIPDVVDNTGLYDNRSDRYK